MLVIMALFVLVIIGSGPRLLLEGTTGVFMERLAAEFRTAVAHVSGFGVAALADDGSHPIELRPPNLRSDSVHKMSNGWYTGWSH